MYNISQGSVATLVRYGRIVNDAFSVPRQNLVGLQRLGGWPLAVGIPGRVTIPRCTKRSKGRVLIVTVATTVD